MLGYALAALFLKLAGGIAGGILLFAFFVAGVIATFNVSLVELFAKSKGTLADS